MILSTLTFSFMLWNHLQNMLIETFYGTVLSYLLKKSCKNHDSLGASTLQLSEKQSLLQKYLYQNISSFILAYICTALQVRNQQSRFVVLQTWMMVHKYSGFNISKSITKNMVLFNVEFLPESLMDKYHDSGCLAAPSDECKFSW